MSMIRRIVPLAALAMILGAAAAAQAQRFQPFIDPGYFSPDFQYFAPAEVGDFGGKDFANTGIYFDYDRMYLNITRPDGEASRFSPFDGDFTWGNRYEIGYMTEDGTGWQAVAMHYWIDIEQKVFQERLDRTNAADTTTTPDPILQDRNPRSLDLRTSLNSARFSSIELNKVWRRKEFHNGGNFEPLVGFRAISFRDQYIRDNYTRFEETITGQPTDPPIPDVEGPYEDFQTTQAIFYNQLFGGQIGGRFCNQWGHWLLSAEVRMFAFANFQILENIDRLNRVRLTGLSGTIELQLNSETIQFTNATQFVWGGEVRAEAAYEFTRDVSFRFGLQFIDLGQGIGRGNTMQFNNQDVVMTGLTFGFTVNR